MTTPIGGGLTPSWTESSWTVIGQTPADVESTAEERHKATLTVAHLANDATDCALLLDALGLSPADAGRGDNSPHAEETAS